MQQKLALCHSRGDNTSLELGRSFSPLQPYPHKHKVALAAYVQWEKIIISDLEDNFDPLGLFHFYFNYSLIVVNTVAREKSNEMCTMKDVRNHLVKITVTQADSNNPFYIAFLQLHDFNEAKNIIISGSNGLVTWKQETTKVS